MCAGYPSFRMAGFVHDGGKEVNGVAIVTGRIHGQFVGIKAAEAAIRSVLDSAESAASGVLIPVRRSALQGIECCVDLVQEE